MWQKRLFFKVLLYIQNIVLGIYLICLRRILENGSQQFMEILQPFFNNQLHGMEMIFEFFTIAALITMLVEQPAASGKLRKLSDYTRSNMPKTYSYTFYIISAAKKRQEISMEKWMKSKMEIFI